MAHCGQVPQRQIGGLGGLDRDTIDRLGQHVRIDLTMSYRFLSLCVRFPGFWKFNSIIRRLTFLLNIELDV